MAWVSPTGSAGTWSNQTLAYDEDTGTYAYEDIGAVGWSSYFQLNCSAIDCDKVQVWSGRSTGNITDIEVGVYYSSAWDNIYSGAGTFDTWVEYPIGSTQSVTALRVRYYTDKKSRQARVHEADFWEVPTGPTPDAYNKILYTSEPPTPNAWNQVKQEAGTGWRKLLYS